MPGIQTKLEPKQGKLEKSFSKQQLAFVPKQILFCAEILAQNFKNLVVQVLGLGDGSQTFTNLLKPPCVKTTKKIIIFKVLIAI